MFEKLQEAIELYEKTQLAIRQATAAAASRPPAEVDRSVIRKLFEFENNAFSQGREISNFIKEQQPKPAV